MPKVSNAYLKDRRDQILDAACRCFARQGYHATSIRDILAEADVSYGALYNYFDGKRTIFLELVRRGRESRDEMAEGIDGDPVDLILEMIGTSSARSVESARVDLGIWTAALDDDEVRDEVLTVFSEMANTFGERLDENRDGHRSRQSAGRMYLAVLLGIRVQLALDPTFDIESCREELGKIPCR